MTDASGGFQKIPNSYILHFTMYLFNGLETAVGVKQDHSSRTTAAGPQQQAQPRDDLWDEEHEDSGEEVE